MTLKAREDDVRFVQGLLRIREGLIVVCHRFPDLRLLCVALETPICLPFPAPLCALTSFGFVLLDVLLLP